MLSEEEREEIRTKQNTRCSLHVMYAGIPDLAKFKKFDPSLGNIGNTDLAHKLSSIGGIVKNDISLFEAENVKRKAESYGLTVKIDL